MKAEYRAQRAKVGLAIAVLALTASIGLPQYWIDWSTLDGGGGTSTGGVYSISSTIGQHDAGGPISPAQR